MIETRYDQERGCGWRKGGGLYLIGGKVGDPCGLLPIPLTVCPCCGEGIKQSRGFTWVDGDKLASTKSCSFPEHPEYGSQLPSCSHCPMLTPGRVGLIWIGEKFYPLPEDYIHEANNQGISRRLAQIPKELEVGKTWIWLAHPKAIFKPGEVTRINSKAGVREDWIPGVFRAFKPTHIEYVVKGTETEEEIADLEKRGITCVRVVRMGGEAAELVEVEEE